MTKQIRYDGLKSPSDDLGVEYFDLRKEMFSRKLKPKEKREYFSHTSFPWSQNFQGFPKPFVLNAS